MNALPFPMASLDVDARHRRLCASPVVRRAIFVTLRGRSVRKGDLDDLVQSVLLKLFESPHRPESERDYAALGATIASTTALDHLAYVAVRERRTDEREVEAIDPGAPANDQLDLPARIDALRHLEKVSEVWQREGFDDEDLTIAVLDVTEHSIDEIGAVLQMSHNGVKNRLARIRGRLRAALTAEGLVISAVLTLLIVVGVLLIGRARMEAKPKPRDVDPAPAPQTQVQPTSQERAESLRAEAESLCDQDDKAACIRALDEADRLDPENRLREDVMHMRSQSLVSPSTPYFHK